MKPTLWRWREYFSPGLPSPAMRSGSSLMESENQKLKNQKRPYRRSRLRDSDYFLSFPPLPFGAAAAAGAAAPAAGAAAPGAPGPAPGAAPAAPGAAAAPSAPSTGTPSTTAPSAAAATGVSSMKVVGGEIDATVKFL